MGSKDCWLEAESPGLVEAIRGIVGEIFSCKDPLSVLSSTKRRKVLKASLPKLKKEKKYWNTLAVLTAYRISTNYLVDGISVTAFYHTDLASLGKVDNRIFFDIKNIFKWYGNLDAVTIVV